MKEGYLPKNQRKKILLLSDDLRLPSGVGVMSKEIVVGTAHKYNWVQIAAAVKHPEHGKIVDISESVSKESGVEDASVRLYPYSGYGDAGILRQLMEQEKPDAILHFTDPRYWIWLYQLEREIRETTPLILYHVWDDLPYPKYNEPYYQSCDAIFNISRQTHNIVRQVWNRNDPRSWQVKYVPHGINPTQFKPVTDDDGLKRVADMKSKLFRGEDVNFVVLYNNRNIRRKMMGDVVLAYREFFLKLTPEQRATTRLLMHTQPVDDNGTDLPRLIQDCAPEIKVTFSTDRLPTESMNDLYNCSDVVINLASNEGFGLGTLEALLAGRMIISNVTGGLQDQMGFVDADGEYLHEEIHYCKEWGSNADGKYKTHGSWVVPVFPNNRALVGSPPTPYIFDDRCSWTDAADAILQVYNLGKDERNMRGLAGREYAMSEGFTAKVMCDRFIQGIDDVFSNWTPRSRFDLIKA